MFNYPIDADCTTAPEAWLAPT